MGICSGCGRLTCTNHLVHRVGLPPSLEGSAWRGSDVWAIFPHGQERFLLSDETQGLSDPAAVGYLKAWASGINLCVGCRYEAARDAAGRIQEGVTQRAAEAGRVRAEFRTAGDPQRLMDLIVGGLEAPNEDWARAWTLICPTFGPPTHDVVSLTAAGAFGTRRPHESGCVPVWRIPGAILRAVFDHPDHRDPSSWRPEDGFLDASGTAWFENGPPIIVKNAARPVLLERGSVPQTVKNGHGVLMVANGSGVQETIETIDPIARIIADAVRQRRGMPLTSHPGRS